jgi:hypothetical protein
MASLNLTARDLPQDIPLIVVRTLYMSNSNLCGLIQKKESNLRNR